MSQPQDVLEDLADSLGQVAGLRVHASTPGQVATPAAVCEIASITAPTTLGTAASYTVRVVLLVQVGDHRSAQERTLTLVDPVGAVGASVFAALLDYEHAGKVTFEGPGLVDFGGQQFSGGLFTVEVFQ